MRIYYPNSWKVLEVEKDGEIQYRILADFKGGYLDGDSWRLSSGAVRVEENNKAFEVVNHTGSVYVCNKGQEGFGILSKSVYDNLEKNVKKLDNVSVRKITMKNLQKKLDNKV